MPQGPARTAACRIPIQVLRWLRPGRLLSPLTLLRMLLKFAFQTLEAFTTGGGTRSINLAIESVLLRGQPILEMYPPGTKLKIITGPILAMQG